MGFALGIVLASADAHGCEETFGRAEAMAEADSCSRAGTELEALPGRCREAMLDRAERSPALSRCLTRGFALGNFFDALIKRHQDRRNFVRYRDPAGRFELASPVHWTAHERCLYVHEREPCWEGLGKMPEGTTPLLFLTDRRERGVAEVTWYRTVRVLLADPKRYERPKTWSEDTLSNGAPSAVSTDDRNRPRVRSHGSPFEGTTIDCDTHEIRDGARLYLAQACYERGPLWSEDELAESRAIISTVSLLTDAGTILSTP